jgi:ferredoxin
MIIASQKPVDEIRDTLKTYPKILIAACGTCVTVCLSGGEKEAKELAALLRLENDAEYRVVLAERQCDSEFLEMIDEDVRWADSVLSLGCGVGVQFMGERYEADGIPVIPGLNTTFMGANRDAGYWTEMCQGCGNCVLEKTGGVCPVARCSKSHFNGPCGGSSDGICEVDADIECGWQLIYNRLKALGRLDRLYETIPPRDWSTSRDGGPRSTKRPDVALEVK